MAEQDKRRSMTGNVLIVMGVLLLLGLGSCYGWTRYRGQQLRAQLRHTPTSAALSITAVPTSTATPAPMPTPLPSPTLTSRSAGTAPPLPTATPGSTASPTAIASSTPPHPEPGPPVRIVIPELNIDVPVVEMGWQVVKTADGPQSEWVIPKNEAGHHINSASLGESGNIVISGHNNIYGRVFEPISQAWDDDNRTPIDDVTDSSDILNGRLVKLYNSAGQEFDYTITAFYRLKDTGVSLTQRIDNARFMQPTVDPQLTLVTCWPPWNNTHRLIVIARPAGSQ